MLAALHTPAIAISKCTGPDGKTVFQDAPCAGKGEKVVVKPASGEAPQQATAAGASSEGQRLQQQLNQMQSERRRRDLEIALPNAYAERASHSAACDQELSALRAKKAMANNNLAGATWQQSLSTEMAAVASRCETRNNNITTNIEALRKECQALGGCK
jgi:hypothetical protein